MSPRSSAGDLLFRAFLIQALAVGAGVGLPRMDLPFGQDRLVEGTRPIELLAIGIALVGSLLALVFAIRAGKETAAVAGSPHSIPIFGGLIVGSTLVALAIWAANPIVPVLGESGVAWKSSLFVLGGGALLASLWAYMVRPVVRGANWDDSQPIDDSWRPQARLPRSWANDETQVHGPSNVAQVSPAANPSEGATEDW